MPTAALLVLAACTTLLDDAIRLPLAPSPQGPASDALGAFASLCLVEGSYPFDVSERAYSAGWINAGDGDLETAGLSRLKKTILNIPGGGARIAEEQRLLVKPQSIPLLVLSAERRIAEGATRSTRCAIHALQPFLETCEALGRLVARPPDSNQRYAASRSHFIRWHSRLEGQPAVIGCEYSPSSSVLPYEGTVLSLSVDHAATSAQAGTVRSSRPGAGDSAR